MFTKKINITRMLALLFCIGLVMLSGIYSDEIKNTSNQVLNSPFLPFVYWAVTTPVCIFYFFFADGKDKSIFIISHFGKYAEAIFFAATYGFGGTTSIALIKGLFNQYFNSEIAFTGFSKMDLISLMIVSSFLLFYCSYCVLRMLVETIQYESGTRAIPDKKQ